MKEEEISIALIVQRICRIAHIGPVMSFEFRILMFGIGTALVIFVIIADISEVEEEIA